MRVPATSHCSSLLFALVLAFVSTTGPLDNSRLAAEAALGYKLPYPSGTTWTVTSGNGNNGHVGISQYAWDFGMSSNAVVVASRSGRVTKIKEDSNSGCRYYSCANQGNYVVVDHGDGTQALYLHLAYRGVTPFVSLNQSVCQGQPIAYSDNTGWSTGPHLHFQVEQTSTGWWSQSVAIAFDDVSSNGGIPIIDQRYTSGNANSCAQTPTPAPDRTPPSVPILSSPANGAVLPQGPEGGLPGCDCTLPDRVRGGIDWLFDWRDSTDDQSGIDSYNIRVWHVNSVYPLVDASLKDSVYRVTQCGVISGENNLRDWRWQVRARDRAGNWSQWSELRTFSVQSRGVRYVQGWTSCP